MARIERSIEINAPPEEVFVYMKDLEKMPEWMPSCKRHKITSEQRHGVGTTTQCVMEQAGRTLEWDAVVTEYIENRKQAWHCDKPSRNDGDIRVRAYREGDEGEVHHELRPSILDPWHDHRQAQSEQSH